MHKRQHNYSYGVIHLSIVHDAATARGTWGAITPSVPFFTLYKYSRQNQYKGTGSEKETSKKDHIRLYETTPSDVLLDWSLNDIHDSWKIDCTLKKAILTQISGKKR